MLKLIKQASLTIKPYPASTSQTQALARYGDLVESPELIMRAILNFALPASNADVAFLAPNLNRSRADAWRDKVAGIASGARALRIRSCLMRFRLPPRLR